MTFLVHLRSLSVAAALASAASASFAQSVPALDDPATVVTVMQFTAHSPSEVEALAERMGAIRDYLRNQPGYIENVLMRNLNSQGKPQFAGVSRWRTIKDWEALWLSADFQKLVKAATEVGNILPSAFTPVK